MGLGGAAIGGGLLGFLGDQISFIENEMSREWHNNPKEFGSDAYLTQYFKDYDKAISDYFMNKQIDYNKWALDYQTNLQNTAYQRAINDMKAAGINPASLSGAQVSSASSPNPLSLSSGYHSGSQAASNYPGYAKDSAFSSLASSAMIAAMAKDNNIAKLMANELVDNAKHAHRIEEIRESYQLKGALKEQQHAHERDINHNPKADYYDELATALRYKRLGLDK